MLSFEYAGRKIKCPKCNGITRATSEAESETPVLVGIPVEPTQTAEPIEYNSFEDFSFSEELENPLISDPVWYFAMSGSNTPIGPYQESEFAKLIIDGAITIETLVCSLTVTRGKWVRAGDSEALKPFLSSFQLDPDRKHQTVYTEVQDNTSREWMVNPQIVEEQLSGIRLNDEQVPEEFCGYGQAQQNKTLIHAANTLPTLINFFLPGLGHIVQGRVGEGIGWFFSYVLFGSILGLVLASENSADIEGFSWLCLILSFIVISIWVRVMCESYNHNAVRPRRSGNLTFYLVMILAASILLVVVVGVVVSSSNPFPR